MRREKIVIFAFFMAVAFMSYNVLQRKDRKVMSDLLFANVEALADHGESSGFRAGYEASSYVIYFSGYGYTTIPCCKYNGNQFSGCSAIDICP